MDENRAIYQVNTTLRPVRWLERTWGQQQFAEQPTLADWLNQASEQQVARLRRGYAALWRKQSRASHNDFAAGWLVLDYDTIDLQTFRRE